MWSEERRLETLKLLLTLPLSNFELVLGKFIACLILVSTALILTAPLPITIALFAGPLDWGPVIGGYIASLFLAAAYIAIGLSISAMTGNQIVSLLFSVIICGTFTIVSSPILMHYSSIETGQILSFIGTTSRFQATTRGVVDLRDLFYYASLTCIFLALNVLNLEKIRWAKNRSNENHKRWYLLTALLIANLVVANLWFNNITWTRIDLSEGKIYTLSPTTHKILGSVKEPLLIKGYFSKKMQPLLQALIPRLKDLLSEYQSAAPDKIKVEFFDPQSDAKTEKEVLENYGITPLPFKMADRYESSIVNAYFDVVIKYGEEYKKLNWQDLVEVSTHGKELEAELRNPEYDLTSAIKKLVSNHQSSGNVFSNLEKSVTFTGYISRDDKLPSPLLKKKIELSKILETFENQSNGKFTYEIEDPGAPDSAAARQLEDKFGYVPMLQNTSNDTPFFFNMALSSENTVVQIPLEIVASASALKHSIEIGLRKFARGESKTIGIYQGQIEHSQVSGNKIDPCRMLTQRLQDEYLIQSVQLNNGYVPENIDLMLVLSPEYLKERQLFALDQFLMRGGTLVISTSPFTVTLDNGLSCSNAPPGVLLWLKSYGVEIQKSMVLDGENFPLITPTKRIVGKTEITERTMAPYPYSVDVSKQGLDGVSGITNGIKQLLFSWCSPILIDRDLNGKRTVHELLKSSENSWTSNELNIIPRYSKEQPLGFAESANKGKKTLAVAVEGKFDSFYKNRRLPAIYGGPLENDSKRDMNFVEKSPETSKLVVFASNTFSSDKVIYLMSAVLGRLSIEPINLVQNAIDWSLNDRELLSIRGHGNFVRALYPPTPGSRMLFELMNYGLALAGMATVFGCSRIILSQRNKSLRKLSNFTGGFTRDR